MSQAEGGGVRHHPPVRLWRIVLTLLSLFLVVHLVVPQLEGLAQIGRRLAHGNWWLVVIALVLEAASFLAYGELTRTVLVRGGTSVSRGLMQRVAVVGASLGKTLPGGAPASTAVMIKSLSSRGIRGPAALAGLAASGVLSSAVLAALLLPASALAILSGAGAHLALGAVGAAVVVLLLAGLLPVAVRAPDTVGRWVAASARPLARGPLRAWIHPDSLGRQVATGLGTTRRFASDPRALALAVWWAAANWLADLAVLLILAASLGARPALLSVPLIYVIGNMTAGLPLTPGGVGIVEAVMIGALTAAGSPGAAAAAAVLGWRLISHWLPIVVGLALLPTIYGRSPEDADQIPA